MIRTVEEYLESLKDGRVLYCLGERVKDVTTHPLLRNVVRSAAMDYFFPNDPKYRDLFVTKNEEGEEVHALFVSPKSAEDLLKRRDIFLTTWRTGGGTQLYCMGIDALEASRVVADRMDRRLGTRYVERVEAYRRYLQKGDLGITGAMTDVKGDRSLRPSKQEGHQDYYVRVVDRQKDGIVVRGAKMHISSTYTNTAKYLFADNYHQAVKTANDICGGIADTIPSHADWNNPETRPWLEKYLGGKAGIPTEHRLRAIRLLKDLTNPHFQIGSIHGEGSLAAQRMFVYAGAGEGTRRRQSGSQEFRDGKRILPTALCRTTLPVFLRR